MITDEQLQELKSKDIKDLVISEKFNIIQSVFDSAQVDYKSRWWLDTIFDEGLTSMSDLNVVINSRKGYCSVGIFSTERDVDSEYESEEKVSTRHDAMLNALTLYCQK